MSNLSKEYGDALINHMLRNTQNTTPGTVFLALHASGSGSPVKPSDIQATAALTELSYTSYARQEITFGEPTGTTDSVTSNTNVIIFPTVDAGEGPITANGFSIWSAVSGGNMLVVAALSAVKTLQVGDSGLIAIGEIDVTFD